MLCGRALREIWRARAPELCDALYVGRGWKSLWISLPQHDHTGTPARVQQGRVGQSSAKAPHRVASRSWQFLQLLGEFSLPTPLGRQGSEPLVMRQAAGVGSNPARACPGRALRVPRVSQLHRYRVRFETLGRLEVLCARLCIRRGGQPRGLLTL